jgi:hypothetical protein
MSKKAQFTQERVKYNGFLFDEPLKGSKSLQIFKISLRFILTSCDIHTGENSQLLTVSNKYTIQDIMIQVYKHARRVGFT